MSSLLYGGGVPQEACHGNGNQVIRKLPSNCLRHAPNKLHCEPGELHNCSKVAESSPNLASRFLLIRAIYCPNLAIFVANMATCDQVQPN